MIDSVRFFQNDRFVLKFFTPGSYLIFILSVGVTLPAHSQDRCSTTPYMQLLRNEGKIKQTDAQFEQRFELRARIVQQQMQTQRTKGGPYEIPVVVHVIHNGELEGVGTNISDTQILSQIEVLNKDFNRMNSDANSTPAEFLPLAGAMDIQFVMARRDPDGLPTTGINRVQGTKTSWSMSDDAEFKALSYWPSQEYMNIWVVNFTANTIGYAQFPVSNMPGLEEYQDGIATTDGIAIDYTTFGTTDAGPFNLDPDFNKGRTTTHEVGHFFGLRHIWGDVSTCSGTDYVDDTPNQTTSTTGCPSHPQVSCSSNKMFQNFLDYTNDVCMNLFTMGQINRMDIVLNDDAIPRRKSLLTSPGLLNPDCNKIDVALLEIVSPGAVSCTRTSPFRINIRNRSCSAVSSIKVEYSVNTGSQQSAMLSITPPLPVNNTKILTIPNISFAEGVNTVTLSITQVNNLPDEDLTNGNITSRLVIDNTQDRIPLREKFDIMNWSIISPQGGINWSLKPTNFGNSASVTAINQGTVGTESWLVSPVLDFSSSLKASVFFDLSYAFNQTDFDQLEIRVSEDCGVTYPVTLYDKAGPDLSNATSATSWTPTQDSHWQPDRYVNLNSLTGKKNVRLAFVFTNARGNNVYLDNIEFYLSDNPQPVDIGDDFYSVYWRNDKEAELTFNLPERMPVRIQVVDILGRTFIDTSAPDILNQSFPVDLGQAVSGIYLLRIQAGGSFFVAKFYLPR